MAFWNHSPRGRLRRAGHVGKPVRAAGRLRPACEGLEERVVLSALAVGSAAGEVGRVTLLDESGGAVGSITPFGANYRGGVNVAVGDVNGDGTPDVIAGMDRGIGRVKVFDGNTLELVHQFLPYGAHHRGGVNVAFGQIRAGEGGDIITGTARGRAVVKVFDGQDYGLVHRIAPYGAGVSGVEVAAANLDGGRVSDLITAAGPGGAPVVKVFDGATGARLDNFFAFDPGYRGGVQIDTGDLDNNAVPDLITTASGPGGLRVRVWAGGYGPDLVGQFIAQGVGRGASVGVLHTAGTEPDRIAVGSGGSAKLFSADGKVVGGVETAGLARGASLASAPPQVLGSQLDTSELQGVNYVPTWPGWFPTGGSQLEDSDFYTDAFRALWDVDGSGQGRRDLQTISDTGFNLVRLFNWGPTRGWVDAIKSGTAHVNSTIAGLQSFLDLSYSQGTKVVVPVSNYFLGDDQYSWAGQVPDGNYSWDSAPQAIRDDLIYFVRSILKDGKIHPAVQSISVGNEFDLGIGDTRSTVKAERVMWWLVNLHDYLNGQITVGGVTAPKIDVPKPFLTAPISNADQGNVNTIDFPDLASIYAKENRRSWLEVLIHGAKAGEPMIYGSTPGPAQKDPNKVERNFTATLRGLDSFKDPSTGAPWYESWYFNSVNLYQSGDQLLRTLKQYETGVATGPTWSDAWPGEQFKVPLLLTELGMHRLNRLPGDPDPIPIPAGASQAEIQRITEQNLRNLASDPGHEGRIADAIANQQVQLVEDFLKNSHSLLGYVLFQFNDEPNKSSNSALPYSEAVFGLTKYYSSTNMLDFRNGTLRFNANTGSMRTSFTTWQNISYPVYDLHPLKLSDGTSILDKLKRIMGRR